MSAASRVKQTASPFPVPQTKEQVNTAIARIGVLQRERALIETAMNDEFAKLKERYEKEAAPMREEIQSLSKGVQIWCEANRAVITNGDKTKTVDFPAGTINWRLTPPKVSLKNIEGIITAFKRLNLLQFLRVKEEVNKEAILAEPGLVAGIAGVTITQGETFGITPFETKLEEVA